MASSDETPGPMPPGDGSVPPGKSVSIGQHVIDKGAQLLQTLKPIKHMNQHVCTFAMYSHDMTRQIETHHYVSRVNQDFLQCAVYDSDDSNGRLIGVEYIISDRIFETLPAEEQKLWHTHEYEIIAGLWVNPRVPEMVQKPELKNLARTYGKFWCTWQVDRGDRLPLGVPALMMSPQGVNLGMVAPELVKKRDESYGISSKDLEEKRVDIAGPETTMNPYANYWMQTGKGFAIDVELTDMKKTAPFP
ncbi:oil body-associated protein 2A [Capsicum galapagoense]